MLSFNPWNQLAFNKKKSALAYNKLGNLQLAGDLMYFAEVDCTDDCTVVPRELVFRINAPGSPHLDSYGVLSRNCCFLNGLVRVPPTWACIDSLSEKIPSDDELIQSLSLLILE